MNALELVEFGRTHRKAGEFLIIATDDYVASRCCLLNGLFPGLRLGSEAIEKFLKAFILYGGGKLARTHRITDLISAATAVKPNFSVFGFEEIVERLEKHYRQRYPDVADFQHNASTAELAGIDQVVFAIYDSLPIHEVPKFRLYGYFFRVCCPWTQCERDTKWLERENIPLQRNRNSLSERYRAMELEIEEYRNTGN